MSQSKTSTVDDAKNSVVMVDGAMGQIGSGVIVGEDSEFIYIVTAHHVVWNYSKEEIGDEILITFRAALDSPVRAELVNSLSRVPEGEIDLAVLKVQKNALNTTIAMPVIGRLFRLERPQRVHFVGRKSKKANWRHTPDFKVASKEEMNGSDDRNLFVQTGVSLQGFSGGGVFDQDWRLAGMTIAGGGLGADFHDDEYTVVVLLSVIVEYLKQFGIPLAPFLGENAQGEIPPGLLPQVPSQSFIVTPHSLGIVMREMLIRTSGELTKPVSSILLVRKNTDWFVWARKTKAVSVMDASSGSIILPLWVREIKSCVFSNLAGGRVFSIAQSGELPNFTAGGYSTASGRIKPPSYRYSVEDDPCDKEFKNVPDIPKKFSDAYELIQRALPDVGSGLSNAFYPKQVHLGSYKGGGKDHHDRIVINFEASQKYSLNDREDFKVFLRFQHTDGHTSKYVWNRDHYSYGGLAGLAPQGFSANIKHVESCMVSQLIVNQWIGVTQQYKLRERPDVIGSGSVTFSISPEKTFDAALDSAGFNIRISSKLSEACEFSTNVTFPPT